jgi:subtilisin family serine protease
MKKMKKSVLFFIAVSVTSIFAATTTAFADIGDAPSGHARHRYILVAKSDAGYGQLRNDAIRYGAKIVKDMPQARTFAVTAENDAQVLQLKSSLHAQAVVPDRIRYLIKPELAQEMGFNSSPERSRLDMGRGAGWNQHVTPDLAFSLPGLMWNVDRINAPKAWKFNTGKRSVLVGVADTGLDYTHSELAHKVARVVDFTDPTLCPLIYSGTPYALTDADWAAQIGGPASTDWNGHGSWIGGNIAGALDGVGINGIAPDVQLVALKISQWCGSAWDSSILDAFYYAADHKIDIVSISFGGYTDRTDPDQNAIYQAYINAVAYARSKGTVIVAAAGNEHLRIGAGGQVISHGPLTVPGDPVPFEDYYGLWETPGGIPGVVDVSATGNVVAGASATCDPGTTGSNTTDATCKPASDTHQPVGVRKKNQLTYYSNYGPRIDLAAPGGARKFNLPKADRGGTGGWPYTTADGYTAYEEFNITSNWALEIPCFVNIGPDFYADECYSTIQGTSMATPHVSAVLALIASENENARHHPDKLIKILKDGAQEIHGNTTQPLSAIDKSTGDLTGLVCFHGYCHLGGKAIADREAYGAGLVDAYAAVNEGH